MLSLSGLVRVRNGLWLKAGVYSKHLRKFQTRHPTKQATQDIAPSHVNGAVERRQQQSSPEVRTASRLSGLHRLATADLLRSIVLGSILIRPRLYSISMRLLGRVANSRQSFMHPDTNPLTRGVLRRCLYNHFCAGITPEEVRKTVAKVKGIGYSGVILCPTREIVADEKEDMRPSFATSRNTKSKDVEKWRDLHLETLAMAGKNDYVGIKFTGAGSAVFKALMNGQNPQEELIAAMHVLCTQAASQSSRLWIDAEQQALQPTVSRWTIEFMRRYNVRGEALISNTYQAYLKSCASEIEQHLRLAQKEGWILGIKLVRGAYIASEVRERIHDTKAQTDNCYDSLAEGLITRSLPGFRSDSASPDVNLFLAGHNALSISRATELYMRAVESGGRFSPTRWGQLLGMADEVSCELLEQSEQSKATPARSHEKLVASPEVYKCLHWGSVGECMHFLMRRATENAGAAQRMAGSTRAMRQELFSRLFRLNLRGNK